MITFFNLGVQGRLGNQLFQYAALKSLALKRGYVAKIPDPNTREWHSQRCLLNRFNIDCDYLTDQDIQTLQVQYDEPDYMKFDPNFFNLPDDTNIQGFFQSTHYFSEFKEQIKQELTPKKEEMDRAALIIDKIRSENPGYEIVSLHLRRGDNADWTDPSQVLLNNTFGEGGELSEDSFYYKYFSNAIKQFEGMKVKYLVFTGGARNKGNTNESDVEWCKRNFQGNQFLFSEGNDSIIDFALIGMCDHNILSHITSFGWWASYIGYREGKRMVAPLYYHPDIPGFTHREGYFTNEFILV